MEALRAIDIKHCEVGTVSSLKDGSVKFTVYTCELRPSESGALMQLHGKACQVALLPENVDEFETVEVLTEREGKTQSERLYATLFVVWKSDPKHQEVPFNLWRERKMEAIIDYAKKQIKES